MKKSLIISDLHIGTKTDAHYVKYQMNFFKRIQEVIMEHDIDRLIVAGDTNDKQQVSNNMINHFFRTAFKNISEMVQETIVVVGNHDLYYKNSNEISSLDNIYQDGQTIVQTEALFLDNILFVPWINPKMKDGMDRLVAKHNKKGNILIGHLELSGFSMNDSVICETSQLNSSSFNKYDMVLSGHFHKPSQQKNVRYLGASLHIDKKYIGDSFYHILTEDDGKYSIEAIKNEVNLFKKIKVDADLNLRDIRKLFENIQDMIIEVFIDSDDLKYVKKIEDVIYGNRPYSVEVSLKNNENFSRDLDASVSFSDEEFIAEYLTAFVASDIMDEKSRKEIRDELLEIKSK